MTVPENGFNGEEIEMKDVSLDERTQEMGMEDENLRVAPMESTSQTSPASGEVIILEPQKHVWTIENFTKLPPQKIASEIFELDGYKWRLLVFPHGNNTTPFEELSVYLEAADHDILPAGWTREVHFCLGVVNHKDETQTISQHVTNTFSARATDWGFSRLILLSKLRNPQLGFLVEDKITLFAEAKVLLNNVHPGMSRAGFNFMTYDSKKETGCVGLKNQGATCYMNSLLQAQFHISAFRKAVYSMPTDQDDQAQTSSIGLALQRIFYRLQFGNKSVGTKELTKAFGWDARDAFTQHDVQELNRVLSDTLERKMKGTPAEGIIEKLFRGKTTSYIQCINIDYSSNRTEDYYDLSLNVKSCKDVYDSFEQYIEVEMLQGANQYFAEGYGLQDAKKGCKFESFPPVLQLQLKRFEYDPYRDANVKVNDRYAFPAVLDLKKYLSDADAALNAVYELHGVLVHSGDVYGGHYYAFIRPTTDPQWLKFDDERVYKVTEKEAIEDNYGGEEVFSYHFHGQIQKTVHKKFANAYMLVYIRKSDAEELLAPVPEDVMPAHLKRRFEEEKKLKEEKKREAAEAHLYTVVKVATERDLFNHPADKFDLLDFESVRSFKVLKKSTLRELKAKTEEAFGIPQNKQRFWPIIRRRNKTSRPDKAWQGADEEKQIVNLKSTTEHRVFLEESKVPNVAEDGTPNTVFFEPIGPHDILLFFKFYDPKETPLLQYVGHRLLSSQLKPTDLFPILRAYKNLPPETPLNLYEEIKPTMVDPMKYEMTLHEGEITNGDIIVFEVARNEPEVPLPRAPDYYEYIQQRVIVQFRKLDAPKETVFHLELSNKMTYDQVVQRVAQKLNWDADKIRFTGHTAGTEQPKPKPIKRLEQTTLSDMLSTFYPYGNPSDILYYETLDIPLQEYENKLSLKLAWQKPGGELVGNQVLLVPKDATLAEAVNELLKTLSLPPPTRKVRVFRVINGKISQILQLSTKVSSFDTDVAKLRAEEEFPEEEHLGSEDRLQQVVHFYNDMPIIHYFGNPFHIIIRQNETVAEIKAKVRAQLKIKDEEWEKWKFAIIPFSLNKAIYPADDEVVPLSNYQYIGLEHPDTSMRKYRRPEKALVIHADK